MHFLNSFEKTLRASVLLYLFQIQMMLIARYYDGSNKSQDFKEKANKMKPILIEYATLIIEKSKDIIKSKKEIENDDNALTVLGVPVIMFINQCSAPKFHELQNLVSDVSDLLQLIDISETYLLRSPKIPKTYFYFSRK